MLRRNPTILVDTQHGFSLMEVLVTLIVFGIGLLGVAALLGSSVKLNNSAYLRSQASFLAENIANRIHGNVRGAWNGSYDGTYTAGGGGAICDETQPCDDAGIAAWDTDRWGTMLAQIMPNASGTVACVWNSGAPGGTDALPPADGICTISIIWNESTDEGIQGQQFNLVIQP